MSISRFRHGFCAEILKPIFSDALRIPSSGPHAVGSLNEALTPSANPVTPIDPSKPKWQMSKPCAPKAFLIATCFGFFSGLHGSLPVALPTLAAISSRGVALSSTLTPSETGACDGWPPPPVAPVGAGRLA